MCVFFKYMFHKHMYVCFSFFERKQCMCIHTPAGPQDHARQRALPLILQVPDKKYPAPVLYV